MKKIVVLGVMLVILVVSACQSPQVGQEMQSSSSGTASTVLSSSNGGLTTPETPLLQDYVRIYEKYCGGIPFDTAAQPSAEVLGFYMLGWLSENSGLERYAVYSGSKVDYYALPTQDAVAFCNLYFGQDISRQINGLTGLRYDASWIDAVKPSEIEVRIKEHKKLESGNEQLTVQRFMNGREWLSAVYEFAPTEIDGQPSAVFNGKLEQGAVVYQFVSMKNLAVEQNAGAGKMIPIDTPQGLVELAELVNGGDWGYQNNVYQLTADLDMSGIAFQPIGNIMPTDLRDPAPKGFNTTFDGQGHTIKNLTIQSEESASGLFGTIGDSGFIGNIKLENCNISSTAKDAAGGAPTGGIVGRMAGGAVNRCTVTGTIRGTNAVGGIVGEMIGGASIQDCRADVTVTGSRSVGGVVGVATGGKIIQCTATGEVNAIENHGMPMREIGGFIGRNIGTTIDRGIVSVDIQSRAAERVGGFAGFNSGNLIGCFYNNQASINRSTIGASDYNVKNTVDLIGMSKQQLVEMGAI